MLQDRLDRIWAVSIHRPYFFSFFGIFLLYQISNILINKLYITFPELLGSPFYASSFIFLQLGIGIGIALSINLSIKRVRELKQGTTKKGMIASAMTISLLASGCPGCIAGLFPAILGLFGVSASLSILPLYGFELQIITLILLGISIWYLTKPITCNIKR